jgi:hypothetical protein
MESDMTLKLTGWRRDWTLMSAFFYGEEIALIHEKLKNLKIETGCRDNEYPAVFKGGQ